MLKSLFAIAIGTGAIALGYADEADTVRPGYPAVAAAISQTMQTYHYDPAELESPGYQQMEREVATLAETAGTDEAFIDGFRAIWADGPFSHVELRTAQQSAEELAAYLDAMRIGGGGAVLTWMDDVAVLTVNTMMGLDTIEEIDAAYAAMAERDTEALIIDLRENGGGAFAVRPLVSHLLAEPVDAGAFVSQRWNAQNDRAPVRPEILAVDPWEGWSILAFWSDVQDETLVRISFAPTEPLFSGPVYVLTSGRTASAAELAADALKSSGRAIIVGENTAGKMLSQKMYDLPGGFQLSLPIADYYSVENGRIEGVGVEPDIATDAADAMAVALGQL